MNRPSKTLKIVISLAVLAIVFSLGTWFGQSLGKKEAKQELAPLLDYAFPPPPAEMKSLTGKITGIYGATINLEAADPDDYLPHTDGSPRRMETRRAVATASTEIKLLNYGKIDNKGLPAITSLKLSDLKIGDAITVEANQNIRDAEEFDAVKIFLVTYQ